MRLRRARRVTLIVEGKAYVLGPKDTLTLTPETTAHDANGRPVGYFRHAPITIALAKP